MRSACLPGSDDDGARPQYPVKRASTESRRDLRAVRRGYGPFRHQAAVFAHVPPALHHLMSMLIELREAATLPKRILELAIVTVSKLNECAYCVAHHTPFLVVEGVSPAGVDGVLEYRDHPEFDGRDKLVVLCSEINLVEIRSSVRTPSRGA
jgi:AhpD family alkylhydroperoxidase